MLRLELPVIYCPDTRGQLVSHICVVQGSDPPLLVCVFCARDRDRAGEAVRALMGAWATEWAPPLDDWAAAALLVKVGATVHGRYVDAVTGDPASRAEVLAAIEREWGAG